MGQGRSCKNLAVTKKLPDTSKRVAKQYTSTVFPTRGLMQVMKNISRRKSLPAAMLFMGKIHDTEKPYSYYKKKKMT